MRSFFFSLLHFLDLREIPRSKRVQRPDQTVKSLCPLAIVLGPSNSTFFPFWDILFANLSGRQGLRGYCPGSLASCCPRYFFQIQKEGKGNFQKWTWKERKIEHRMTEKDYFHKTLHTVIMTWNRPVSQKYGRKRSTHVCNERWVRSRRGNLKVERSRELEERSGSPKTFFSCLPSFFLHFLTLSPLLAPNFCPPLRWVPSLFQTLFLLFSLSLSSPEVI